MALAIDDLFDGSVHGVNEAVLDGGMMVYDCLVLSQEVIPTSRSGLESTKILQR